MLNIGQIYLITALILNTSVFFKPLKRHVAIIVFGQFALLTLALLELIDLHITTNYSFVNVLQNSHTLLPMLYKITGTWANHEGSMLLTVWFYSLFALVFSRSKEVNLYATQLQSALLCLLLLFLITASNPFITHYSLFPKGSGFNPLLQDIALSIHPPLLYAGYAGFVIPYSMYITGAPIVRRWVLTPWGLLTAGIGLGSWWSYRELGWGGFWFWDPVENISLIVWLSSTILLHSTLLKTTRWSQIFCVITFLLSILSISLVRSGVLSSVHSFAYDQQRGALLFVIFMCLAIFSLFCLIKNMQKSPYNKQEITSIFNKGTAILASNIALTSILFIILIGILYPMLHKLITHNTIVVDENFYTRSLSVPGLTLLAVMALSMSKRVAIFLVILTISTALTCALYYLQPISGVIKILFVTLSITALISAMPSTKKNITAGLAHTGFAMLMLGCSLYYAWHFEGSALITKGVTQQIGKYSATLQEIRHFKRDNFLVRQAVIEIRNAGVIMPETRFYPVEKSFTTESSIIHTFTGDIYSTIGEIRDTKILLRLQFKPFISLVWLGVAVIALSVPIGIIKWKYKSKH